VSRRNLIFQITPQDIAENESAKVADVSEIPNRRPANVHPHFAFFQRVKLVDRARERVKKPKHKVSGQLSAAGIQNRYPDSRLWLWL
jgi:hypothetical protein